MGTQALMEQLQYKARAFKQKDHCSEDVSSMGTELIKMIYGA